MTTVIKDIKGIYDNSDNQSRRSLLITSLIRFFSLPDNLNIFLNVINGKGKTSLRLLDWLITNYAKANNTIYNVNSGGTVKSFNVYLNYKTQLKAYSKRQFDPFQRRERISFFIEDENNESKQIITTIGQLNFFRWAIQNDILIYAEKNLKDIEHDMNQSIQQRKNVLNKTRIKRKGISSTIIQQHPRDQITF